MTPEQAKKKLDNDIKLLEGRNEQNEVFADAVGRQYGVAEKNNVYDTLNTLRDIRTRYDNASSQAIREQLGEAGVFKLSSPGEI